MRYSLAALTILLLAAVATGAEKATVEQVVDVAPVWSGHPVRFCLLTDGKRQFVAFYDAERRMTVGSRPVDSHEWQLVRLPSSVGWDSHNSLTMTIDDDGFIHLSGNMHCVPLIYFRTRGPYDVASFEKIPAMVGAQEKRCTYPKFLRGASSELIYTYRDGGSGNGNQIWNVYDLKAKVWRRLLDQPLFDGQGKMNAYFTGPVRDADGVFHVCWVWRDTPDCRTNHHLSYARSNDLIHWETSAGKPLALPITLETGEVIDPAPPGGGMLNGNTQVGFDSQGRVMVAYHKFDAEGNTQLYNARREDDGWKIYQTSDWGYRWDFHGGGTIIAEIRIGPVIVQPDGTLTQSYRHAKHGSGNWRIDERTLKPLGPAPRTNPLPREIGRLESTHPGMQVRTFADLGQSAEPGVRYLLRWETLPPNRDRPPDAEAPKPSMLRVYRLRQP